MEKRSLYSMIDEQRINNGEKTAIQFAGEKITYSRFMYIVNNILELIRQRGISHEAIIVATSRNPRMIAAMIAIVESGNYYVPIDYIYPKDRIDYIVAHSKAHIVVVDLEHKDLFKEYDTIVLSDGCELVLEVDVDEDRIHSTAYCLYTSGSTGNPKGVLILEDALVNFIVILSILVDTFFTRILMPKLQNPEIRNISVV